MLKNLPFFLIVFSGLLSVKRAVAHNEIETALEVLCSSKLNFQFLEMNFQNERTVSHSASVGPKLIGIPQEAILKVAERSYQNPTGFHTKTYVLVLSSTVD